MRTSVESLDEIRLRFSGKGKKSVEQAVIKGSPLQIFITFVPTGEVESNFARVFFC